MENTQNKEALNGNEARYLRAKERIQEVKKFYANAMSYAGFTVFLAVINYYMNEWRYMWFLWVVFFWGIAIATQAIKLYGANLFFGKDWEQRKIKELMNDDLQNNKWD